MKTLLLILSFCITSISFSQDYNTQIDEKELENTVYQNRINNRAKYQGVISNFEIAIDVENSILTKEELAKKINSLDGVLLVSYDRESKTLNIKVNKTANNEIIPSLKDAIYAEGYTIYSINESYYKIK